MLQIKSLQKVCIPLLMETYWKFSTLVTAMVGSNTLKYTTASTVTVTESRVNTCNVFHNKIPTYPFAY